MPSTKPVLQKLGLKPAHRAAKLNVPKEVEKALGNPPPGCKFEEGLSGEFDFLLGFYDSAKELKGDFRKIKKSLKKSGMAWVCWRKGNVSDLSRDALSALVDDAGLEAVSLCAVNDDWSAAKVMYPKVERK
jgi:hypothetical protein